MGGRESCSITTYKVSRYYQLRSFSRVTLSNLQPKKSLRLRRLSISFRPVVLTLHFANGELGVGTRRLAIEACIRATPDRAGALPRRLAIDAFISSDDGSRRSASLECDFCPGRNIRNIDHGIRSSGILARLSRQPER